TIFTALNRDALVSTAHIVGLFFFWYKERVPRCRNTDRPKYNLCCKWGSILLAPYQPPPQPFFDLLSSHTNNLSSHFFDHIRQYNTMFAMTSMGAKVNEAINDGRGPYIFKVSGQVYHRVGSLIPSQEYAQLYIFDTDHEANDCIVASLIQMLDTYNPIVKLFRTARERLSSRASDQYNIRLFGKADALGDIYSTPGASEVVGLVVGDIGSTGIGRDNIIENHSSQLQQINEKHRKFMAMQYPILFPYGEDGYHEKIMYHQTARSQYMKRQATTMAEYYACRLHDRPGDFNTPLRCGRLAPYNSLAASVSNGLISGSSAGQRIYLPAFFIGSPRYLYQKYLDCIKIWLPRFVVTFTSNTAWPEIMMALPPGLQPSDSPKIIDQVFKMKLNILMDDIKKRKIFGPIYAGPLDATKIDTFILAQLPDPTIDPIGYDVVSSFMVYGPYRPLNSNSVCMSEGKCSKFYPKKFCDQTTILENGFP
ncbi:hypothetical protein U9M48_036828, partial [Paspalum notatum var. saurae]